MRRVFRLPFSRPPIEREVDAELAFHLEMRERQLIAAGMDPQAAKHEALRQFGDMHSVRDFCVTLDEDRERAMKRANRMEELGQDLRYAFRTLRRNPAFTAVVVLTLALGIGSNTAIFTLIDAVILRHIPVRYPEELVAIGHTARVGPDRAAGTVAVTGARWRATSGRTLCTPTRNTGTVVCDGQCGGWTG